MKIERETIRRIARHSHITAVKDCSGDIETTMALINDGEVEVLTGEDLQILTNLALGGAGAISASAHIRADLYVRLFKKMDSCDLKAARSTFYRRLP